jgi:hypothetical protein
VEWFLGFDWILVLFFLPLLPFMAAIVAVELETNLRGLGNPRPNPRQMRLLLFPGDRSPPPLLGERLQALRTKWRRRLASYWLDGVCCMAAFIAGAAVFDWVWLGAASVWTTNGAPGGAYAVVPVVVISLAVACVPASLAALVAALVMRALVHLARRLLVAAQRR